LGRSTRFAQYSTLGKNHGIKETKGLLEASKTKQEAMSLTTKLKTIFFAKIENRMNMYNRGVEYTTRDEYIQKCKVIYNPK